jgi:hypothetical protein
MSAMPLIQSNPNLTVGVTFVSHVTSVRKNKFIFISPLSNSQPLNQKVFTNYLPVVCNSAFSDRSRKLVQA